MLYEKLLTEDLVLILYDFNSDKMRTKFRNELKGKKHHAMEVTQSCYLMTKETVSDATLAYWNRKYNQMEDTTIMIFNDASWEPRQKQRLAKKYVKHLHNLVEEANVFAKDAWKRVKEWEEKVADEDPEVDLRGWATIMSGARGRFEEIQKTINRVGNEDDEFELQKLSAFVDRIDARFKKGKELYIRNKGRKD